MSETEARIKAASDALTDAARFLIGLVRAAEASERARSSGAQLSLEIELTSGGVETWEITIKRTEVRH